MMGYDVLPMLFFSPKKKSNLPPCPISFGAFSCGSWLLLSHPKPIFPHQKFFLQVHGHTFRSEASPVSSRCSAFLGERGRRPFFPFLQICLIFPPLSLLPLFLQECGHKMVGTFPREFHESSTLRWILPLRKSFLSLFFPFAWLVLGLFLGLLLLFLWIRKRNEIFPVTPSLQPHVTINT